MGCSSFIDVKLLINMICGSIKDTFKFVKGQEGQAKPTAHLWLLVVVYGALSTYGEILGMLFNMLTVPLQKFYNESVYEHYGFYLDDEGMNMVLSTIANLPLLGAALSVLFLIPKMDIWGRKGVALHVRSFLGIIIAFCFIFAKILNSIELFIFGEFIIGVYMPLKIAVVKHYLSECAPTAYRGFITHSSSMLIILISLPMTLLLNPGLLGNEERWHYMGFVSLGLNFLSYSIGIHLPESPKFLYFKNKPKKQVIEAIRAYQGKHVDIEEIFDSYYKESQITHSSQYKFMDLWRDETLRSSFILVCLIVFGTTLTVSQILMRYEMILLLEFGFTQQGVLFLATGLQIGLLPCLLFVPILFEKLGRRPLLLIGTFMHIILPITISGAKVLSDQNGANTWSMSLGLVSLIMQASSNLFGHGAIYLILIADMIPEGAKVIVSQVCLLISYIGPFPIIFLYPILVEHTSGFIFLPFSLIQLFCFVYLYHNLFETKQKEVYKNVEIMEEQVKSRANSFYNHHIIIRRQRASTLQPLLGDRPIRKYGRIERFNSLSSGIKDWA